VVVLRYEAHRAVSGDQQNQVRVHAPSDAIEWVIKRISAVAGDPVPASVLQATWGVGVVPPGSIVVLGDNSRSFDSRSWGFVSVHDVLGVAIIRLSSASNRRGNSGVLSRGCH
jgi:type IV secretory pathway protease TraF